MDYYSKSISNIRRDIDLNKSRPVYNGKRWKKKKLNCYAYALDIPVENPKKRFWFPGCISDEQEDMDIYNNIVERLKRDLDFLGISYRDNTDDLSQDEWRIAIYYRPTHYDWPIEFHILRQDDDGTWSEKPSWNRAVRKIGKSSDMPPNLEECKLYLETILIIKKTM